MEAVQLLLHHGATRDAATKDLYTPLHIAVKEGHEDVVEILLDSGAKHNTMTRVSSVYHSCCSSKLHYSQQCIFVDIINNLAVPII